MNPLYYCLDQIDKFPANTDEEKEWNEIQRDIVRAKFGSEQPIDITISNLNGKYPGYNFSAMTSMANVDHSTTHWNIHCEPKEK